MRVFRFLAGLALAATFLVIATAGAGADSTSVCTGTLEAPGVLAGTYHSNVVVQGICFVNGGAATIAGNLTIAPGGGLNATFALDDQPGGSGASSLSVARNIVVQNGGVLLLGCEPNFSPCSDDPAAATGGTLTSSAHVRGSLISTDALGVIVHASTIDGNAVQNGGGGGKTCTPTGIFAAFGSPAFSDYEDNAIGGNLAISGLRTCWLGSLRNTVRGNLISSHNAMDDPDAGEVVQNSVIGNIVCLDNSPAVQFGDSGAAPNQVAGNAVGQCGFNVFQPDPNFPNGDGTGGPQPISVKFDH